MKADKRELGFLTSLFATILIPILYFLVITPISLILRVFGKTFLELSAENKDSYWQQKEEELNYKDMY